MFMYIFSEFEKESMYICEKFYKSQVCPSDLSFCLTHEVLCTLGGTRYSSPVKLL